MSPYYEIRPSVVYPGEWVYRKWPGHGFWLSARHARRDGLVETVFDNEATIRGWLDENSWIESATSEGMFYKPGHHGWAEIRTPDPGHPRRVLAVYEFKVDENARRTA